MKIPFHTLKNNFRRVLSAVAMLAVALSSVAVTDAEMDEARAIAAKFYVRYINNGAGYLDNWLPKSMAELEKKLTNNTDRENLKAFKNVSTPTDYASWDKNKLVAYWSESFFKENASGLDAKAADNGMCRKQVRQAIERLAIAAAPAVAEAAPSESGQPTDASAQTAPEDKIAEELAQVDAEIQEAQDMVEREAAKPAPKESSGTWVYIMILAILVGVVIFLVVYASRTMKGQSKASPRRDMETEEDSDYEPAPVAPLQASRPSQAAHTPQGQRSVAEDSRMREKYAEALAAKAEEIRALNRKLADKDALAGRLKEENRMLTAEVESLRGQIASLRQEASGRFAPVVETVEETRPSRPSRSDSAMKEIYLGRANSKGIFVRADRHAVDGQSIYKLSTSNGRVGTFSLIHNPIVEEQALDDPGRWLSGGCIAKDMFYTEGFTGIRTETPGTAVFRDGAWRVERKARIRYC